MNKLALLALALTACDDTVTCPAIAYSEQLELVLSDDDWNADTYRIYVDYEDRGRYSYQCTVQVPFVSRSGAIDGGVRIVRADDAGYEYEPAQGVQPCMVVADPGNNWNPTPTVSIGRALTIVFPGTPKTIKLTVDSDRGRLLENQIRPQYEESYPHGRECGGPRTAVVRVVLP